MKHLAVIQSEFLKSAFTKQARDWDDLTLEEQKGYLQRHPKSKRKLTGQSDQSSSSTDTDVKKPKDYAVEYGPMRDTGFRQEESDIIINRNNQSYKVGVFKRYTGREQDTISIKWDASELKRLLPTIDLDKYKDSSKQSGGQYYHWEPLEVLENDLRK
jgi:hypothetical protein